MQTKEKNSGLIWKQRAGRLLAVLFVLYALADVSVLQEYCGNENLGIPPAHHSLEQTNNSIKGEQETCTESKKADCRQSPDNQDYDHHHECFCWQQVSVGFSLFNPPLVTNLQKTQPPVYYENKYSNSDLSGFFRPPQTL